MPDPHDILLQELQACPSVEKVLLVARLADPRLSQGDPDSLRVVIPDLHLLTPAADARYPYHTNCLPQLRECLLALKSVRRSLADGQSLNVYVIGDFADLWRQGNDDGAAIVNAHFDIYGNLTGTDGSLEARFLLGNHDFDLPKTGEFQAWDRRYYFPIGDGKPAGMIIHGDIFDWVERLPEWFKRFFVYVFGVIHGASDYGLEEYQQSLRTLQLQQDYRQYIQAASHPLQQLHDMAGGMPAGANFNVLQVSSATAPGAHEFLAGVDHAVQQVQSDYSVDLRSVTIGHTHHARINVLNRPDGSFLALVDCGAWIENCVPAGGETMPSAQIAAMCNNDVRIYQIVAKESAGS